MNYETIKSLVLAILVSISFLLTYILWSYQPNYDYFYDASYVNEVDIGGVEKTRNDLIRPTNIIFKNGDNVFSFLDPIDKEAFYQDISSVVLYDYNVNDTNDRPENEEYIEIIFPDEIPAEMMTSLFTFEEEITPPSWSFKRMFLTLNEENRTLQLIFNAASDHEQVTAIIEKSETYELLSDFLDGDPSLREYLEVNLEEPIYIPKDQVTLASKTLVASQIDPDDVVNALFVNPNLVTSNMREAYFTDGQRGMRLLHDGRSLEYINPIQSTSEVTESNPIELFDLSVTNINDHKGWTNNFLFDEIDHREKNIKYRLYYDGYPIYNRYSLSVMQQSWRDQVLFEYERPLIQMGNLLNTEEMVLPSGKKIIELLQNDKNYQLEYVQDITLGYELRYIGDNHSLILEPNWFILYDNGWMTYDLIERQENLPIEGGD